MPWQIQAATFDEWELTWGDKLTPDEIKKLPENYVQLGLKHGEPFHPDLPTIPYLQSSDHSVIPSICQGRYGFDVFVDQEVRSLIEEMDTAEHYFHPIDLHLKSGEVLRDRYFLLRLGGLLDGIVPEDSEVEPVFRDGKLLRYERTKVRPKITWKAGAIAGRHFWMDRCFTDNIYCSDDFLNELKRRKIGHFRALPTFCANLAQ